MKIPCRSLDYSTGTTEEKEEEKSDCAKVINNDDDNDDPDDDPDSFLLEGTTLASNFSNILIGFCIKMRKMDRMVETFC